MPALLFTAFVVFAIVFFLKWWLYDRLFNHAVGVLQNDVEQTEQRLRDQVALGEAHLRAGRFDEAAEHFIHVAKTGDRDAAAKALVNAGSAYHEGGHHGRAIAYWAKAAESGHPDVAPAAMANIGVASAHVGATEQAIDWFARAADSGHSVHGPSSMLNLGEIHAKNKDIEEARRWFRKASIAGDAETHRRATDWIEALDGMEKLGLFDDDVRIIRATGRKKLEAALVLADQSLDDGNAEQAIDLLTMVAESDDVDLAPFAQYKLGVTLQEQGRSDEAAAWWTTSAESGHREFSFRSRYALGVHAFNSGTPEEAIRWFTGALDGDDLDERAWTKLGLARCHMTLGDEDRAVELWSDVARSEQQKPMQEATKHLAQHLTKVGRPDEAREWIGRLVDRLHANAEARQNGASA